MASRDRNFSEPYKSNTSLSYQGFDVDSYEPMPIVYQLRYSILQKIRRGEDILPEIHGREETKNDVIRAILSGSHPYLVSEEGTGKTRLARSLASLLPKIPVIKGCPYNDDPKWPSYWLCPRCRSSKDPIKEYGIDFVPGGKRFSRIQGNEYTSEAKLLGLKDIQAIAQGRSPSDPQVFTGTGVFRANRGILFIDELPAIRTKVQVLLHPILEEKKAILEEYNWEHPLDLLLIATGNPQGFSHVNEVPRPLLDRMELIYMDLPEEEVERDIIFQERFKIKDSYYLLARQEQDFIPCPDLAELERRVAAPWWIIDIVNKSVRYSRICSRLDRTASIRGGIKAIDHTYATVELKGRKVANLRDACEALKLALRGRIGLSPDLIDFENPKRTLERTDRIVEDFIWNIFEDMPDIFRQYDKGEISQEIYSMLSEGVEDISNRLPAYQELKKVMDWMKMAAPEKVSDDALTETERDLVYHPDKVERQVLQEYNYSALETLVNIAVHKKIVDEFRLKQIFVPHMFRD